MTSVANHTALLQHPKIDPRRDSLHETNAFLNPHLFWPFFWGHSSGIHSSSSMEILWFSYCACTDLWALLSLPPPKASKNKRQKNKERKGKKKKFFSTEQTHPWLHSAHLSSAFVSTRDFLHLILICQALRKLYCSKQNYSTTASNLIWNVAEDFPSHLSRSEMETERARC